MFYNYSYTSIAYLSYFGEYKLAYIVLVLNYKINTIIIMTRFYEVNK